jgi:hypothetical protein
MKPQQPSLSLLVALLLVAAPVLAAPTRTGTWSASVKEKQLQLSLRTKGEHGGQTGFPVPLTAFQGLSTADGDTAPFQLIREAGTFKFEGSFYDREGAGHYQFEPSESYVRSMASLGYPKLTADEQYQLALFDISTTRVKELAVEGYKNLDLDTLMAMNIHGVTPEFIREMRGMGYPNVTPDELVSLRIHGIDPEFVRSLSGGKGGGDTRKKP